MSREVPDAELTDAAVDVVHVAQRLGQPVTLDGEILDALVAVLDRQASEVERLGDALYAANARTDQVLADLSGELGQARDGVMVAIAEAGVAPYVCDDDDLPDMVRHALTAAKKLAQPALWTYNDRGEPENQAGAA